MKKFILMGLLLVGCEGNRITTEIRHPNHKVISRSQIDGGFSGNDSWEIIEIEHFGKKTTYLFHNGYRSESLIIVPQPETKP